MAEVGKGQAEPLWISRLPVICSAHWRPRVCPGDLVDVPLWTQRGREPTQRVYDAEKSQFGVQILTTCLINRLNECLDFPLAGFAIDHLPADLEGDGWRWMTDFKHRRLQKTIWGLKVNILEASLRYLLLVTVFQLCVQEVQSDRLPEVDDLDREREGVGSRR